jgi:transposase
VTGQSVELAYLGQGYTDEEPAEAAGAYGIHLQVVKHTEAKKGFVLLPRRWVVERGFAWATRFRRLIKDRTAPSSRRRPSLRRSQAHNTL